MSGDPDSNLDEKPWYQVYEEHGMPETAEPYPNEPVHQIFVDKAREEPDLGVYQLGRKYTYPELLSDVKCLASALSDLGISKGDRVASIMSTSIQFIVSTHAISMAGASHVPNDFLEAEEDIAYRLSQSEPDVLIGQYDYRDLVFSLSEELGIENVVLTEIDDYSDNPPEKHPDTDEDVEWLADIIDQAEPNPPDIKIDPREDIHSIMFTGGTTGRPKGCQLSHFNIRANLHQLSSREEDDDNQLADMIDKTLLALPMYHAYGYIIGMMVQTGETDMFLVSDPRDTDQMTELIEEHGIYVVIGVPAQFIELLDEEIDHKIIGLSGSAPLARDVQSRFSEKNLGISQGYGLSEMTAATHVNPGEIQEQFMGMEPQREYDHPSIGVPIPDTEVKIRDVDNGEEIPVSKVVEDELRGEMCLAGPQRMVGYLDASRDPFDTDGFIATGDVVKIDSRGMFYVVDRVKNMVNVSGLKVYTEEVDDVLFSHPGVKRAATIGIPDPDRPGSERVKIYIEPNPGYEDDVNDELIEEYLEGKIARHAMPEEIEFMQELPLTDVGKINKNELREMNESTSAT